VIVGIAFLAGVVIAWALGARVSALADVRVRRSGLVFASLAVQLVIFTPLANGIPASATVPLHLLSYALLAVFVLVNVRTSALWIVATGLLLNLAAIASNGGRMPITMGAWTGAGGDPAALRSGVSDNNVLVRPGTHLRWLGDVFPLPHQIPFATAISIGDILVVLGAVAFVYQSCAPTSSRRRVTLFAPIRQSARFRRVIVGRLVSGTGDWIAQAAIVTWIFLNTRSTTLVSAFLVVRIVSVMLGGFSSASMLDRVGGFRTLAFVEAARGGMALAMIPLAVSGMVWPVVGLSAASAFLSALTNPSAAGLLPDLLPEDQLNAGNALHNLAPSLTSILGAGLAAVVVVEWGIGVALAVDLSTFVVAALLYKTFSRQPSPQRHEQRADAVRRRTLVWAVVRDRSLLGVTTAFVCSTAAFGLLNATTAAFFAERFHDAHAYGFVAATIGLGYLFGETLTGRARRAIVVRRSTSVALIIAAGALFLVATSPQVATAMLGMFVLGAADGVTEVVHDTLVQLHAPRAVLGGIFATIGSLERLGMIAGVLAAPLLIAASSPSSVIRWAGALMILGAGMAAICLWRTTPTQSPAEPAAAVPSHASSRHPARDALQPDRDGLLTPHV
jgi:MFS family permease